MTAKKVKKRSKLKEECEVVSIMGVCCVPFFFVQSSEYCLCVCVFTVKFPPFLRIKCFFSIKKIYLIITIELKVAFRAWRPPLAKWWLLSAAKVRPTRVVVVVVSCCVASLSNRVSIDSRLLGRCP